MDEQQSPELKNALADDAEFKFFHELGNALFVVETWIYSHKQQPSPDKYVEVARARERFYHRLQDFRYSGYAPKGKITPEALNRFDLFRNLEWTVEQNFTYFKDYFLLLKSEE